MSVTSEGRALNSRALDLQLDNETAMIVAREEADSVLRPIRPGHVLCLNAPVVGTVRTSALSQTITRTQSQSQQRHLLTIPSTPNSQKQTRNKFVHPTSTSSSLKERHPTDINKRQCRGMTEEPATPRSSRLMLSFTPTTSSGRKRTLTKKGEETYRM